MVEASQSRPASSIRPIPTSSREGNSAISSHAATMASTTIEISFNMVGFLIVWLKIKPTAEKLPPGYLGRHHSECTMFGMGAGLFWSDRAVRIKK